MQVVSVQYTFIFNVQIYSSAAMTFGPFIEIQVAHDVAIVCLCTISNKQMYVLSLVL